MTDASQPLEPIAQPPHAPYYYGFPQSTEGLLAWSFATTRLEQAHCYWLATVRQDGRPHATPLWGVWVDGALYFDGSPETQWARNIATHPQITMHLESGSEVVILEGYGCRYRSGGTHRCCMGC